jgi:hypothetical protein
MRHACGCRSDYGQLARSLHRREWLAFVAERNGNQELYRVKANGLGMVQLANTYAITEAAPRWQRAP